MTSARTLTRTLGLPGAVALGLGSILGTGVFVSLAVAAGVVGGALPWAIAAAALLAAANGLSSAQLAAVHPVAGGSYAYGRRFLSPSAGALAGWTFLIAKSASAATAAHGTAAYVGHVASLPPHVVTLVELAVVLAVTALVAAGLQRSNAVNAVLVAVTVASLVAFVAAAARTTSVVVDLPSPASVPDPWGFGLATALTFVAFTGYGRVATLGEEVRSPRSTIPTAIVVTLLVTTALYLSVSWAALSTVGADGWARAVAVGAAPLAVAAETLSGAWLATVLAWSAVVAMFGVSLNLVLGLSRVAFAMARDGELPSALARLDGRASPTVAVWAIGGLVALLAAAFDVRTSWTVSAVSVLVYYAVANAAALAVADGRFVPKAVSWLGLVGCLALTAFVPWPVAGPFVATLATVAGVRAAVLRRLVR